MIDRQETFDTVITHLVRQGRQSIDFNAWPGGSCMYRFECEDGTVLRCAAGALVPDDAPQPPERETVTQAAKLLHMDGWYEHDLELVTSLQKAHDWDDEWNSTGFVGWERARSIAYYHGLKWRGKDYYIAAAKQTV